MSFPFESLNAEFAVAPQLEPDQMAAVAAAGFRSVINNRPDLEGGASQPASDSIAQAAAAAGLEYAYLPVIPSDLKQADVDAMAALIARLPTPVLAFCRSGARAAKLYQLAGGRTR